jgi:putative SOS response-associated peptidase YedK
MCGRFVRKTPVAQLAQALLFPETAPQPPRYNIAPTQLVAAVRAAPQAPARELAWLRWGLIPSWADDPKIGNRMINARAETASGKPSFRSAFRQRRCLILADGFYEWQKTDGKKLPHYFHMKDGKPFAFAGLWEHWEGAGGIIESCTILTTDANDLLRTFHDRMPAIVCPRDYETWLNPAIQDPETVQPLLRPYPAEAMTSYPVSVLVNSPRNESAQCAEPACPAASISLLPG